MKLPNEIIEVTALPKQAAFLRSQAREVLLSGGFGCGKSMALAIKLAMRATTPNAREILARKTFATLGRSTLATLLEGDGQTPPVLPAGTYRHNKQEHVIAMNGGGSIHYLGCDDPLKLGSINATGVAIDEAAELDKSDLVMLRGRCRVELPTLAPQIYMATNPRGPLHHLAMRFGLDGVSTPARGCEAITMQSSENPNLPAAYVSELQALAAADRARFFEGRWVSSEGLVYSQFDHVSMVKRRTGPWTQVVAGVDCGFNDPDVILTIAKDEAGRVHVLDEFYKSGNSTSELVAMARLARNAHHVETFAIDPSAARVKDEMQAANLYVVGADNAILDGIRAVQKCMTIDGEGVPGLTVDPSCVNTIRELGTYSWTLNRDGTGKDKPRDAFNHAMDALRYGVMYLTNPSASWVGVVQRLGEDDDDEMTDAEYKRYWSARLRGPVLDNPLYSED